MANGFEIITAGLFVTLMSVNRGISSRASQVLAVLERDVFTLTVFITFGETEIDNVDIIAGALSSSDQKVVRLDISVNDALAVNFLDTTDHLCSNE